MAILIIKKGTLNLIKILDSIFDKDLPINYKLRDMLIKYPNGGIIQDLADYILQTNRYNDSLSGGMKKDM